MPVAGQGTIYIRADGSIDPLSAPITSSDNVTYSVTGDIGDPIVVERDNIVIEGMGYLLSGSDSGSGIDLINRKGVTVRNLQINTSDKGVYMAHSSNCSVSNCTLTVTTTGFAAIYLYNSSSNEIVDNKIVEDAAALFWTGISFYDSSNNSISGNDILCHLGMNIQGGFNIVSGNTVTIVGDGAGIVVWDPGYNIVTENDVKNVTRSEEPPSRYEGISLYDTDHNVVIRNNLTQNSLYLIDSSYNNISMNNMVQSGISVEANWSPDPRYFKGSMHNLIAWNNITDSRWGIILSDAQFNTVLENNITGSYDYGIMAAFYVPAHCTFRGNFISNSSVGVHLSSVQNLSFSGNSLRNNSVAIEMFASLNNTFSHNNFVDNTEQIRIYDPYYGPVVSADDWDDGYPIGGNYWSDYCGVDVYRGKYQNDTGSDGIGDTPYIINSTNRDNYPLMNPYDHVWDSIVGDVNKDGKVDMRDIGLLCFAFGTTSSDPRWNPDCDLNGDGIVNARDLGISCNSYGKKT